MEEAYLWPVNAESQITPKRMVKTISLVKNKNIPSVFCESTVSNESQMVVASETGANFGGDLFVDSLSHDNCLLYTSPSPRDRTRSRMPSSA